MFVTLAKYKGSTKVEQKVSSISRNLSVHRVDMNVGIVYTFQCSLMDGFPTKKMKIICMCRLA